MTRLQLFCIPHAGGSSAPYYRWRRIMPEDVLVTPIELAGHGRRLSEDLFDDAYAAARDVAHQIQAHRDPSVPYAIWGHSMGSLLAYEAYFVFREWGAVLPLHIVFSGRGAPQNTGTRTKYSAILDDEQFIAAIQGYGGSTREALAAPELRKLFLPVLRADFKLCEGYTWRPRHHRMACDITVVNGRDDPSVNPAAVTEWARLSSGRTRFLEAPGDHFFCFQGDEVVLQTVRGLLARIPVPTQPLCCSALEGEHR